MAYMTKKQCEADPINFFISIIRISLLIILLNFISMPATMAATPEIPKKHLIPYVEADGNPNDYSRLVWLSPTRVAFTSNKDVYWASGRLRKQYEEIGDIQREHLDAVFEILIFDTETGKTTHYHDGWLGWDVWDDWWLASEDRKIRGITIELERVRNKNGFPWKSDLSGAYNLLLTGPIGEERSVTHQLADNPHPLKKCPNNPDAETKYRLSIPLKKEHGCLQYPDNNASPEKRVVYFKSDGNRIELDVPKVDILGHIRWIEWLRAYLLGEEVSRSGGSEVFNNHQVLTLMKPDGELLTLQMNDWGLYNARPTRAGIVAFRPLLASDGIYLWRNSVQLQLAEGFIKPGYLEVSPDGCHVAYIMKKRYSTDSNLKLRVIDVCIGMGVSADTNPFNW